MTDIVEELRTLSMADPARLDVLRRAADEIESLRRASSLLWQPIRTAPRDQGPLLLFCPGLSGHVARNVVVGMWCFDPNRRPLGYWTSDVGSLDLGFVETGPWIEYPELHPELWAPLPKPPPAGA